MIIGFGSISTSNINRLQFKISFNDIWAFIILNVGQLVKTLLYSRLKLSIIFFYFYLFLFFLLSNDCPQISTEESQGWNALVKYFLYFHHCLFFSYTCVISFPSRTDVSKYLLTQWFSSSLMLSRSHWLSRQSRACTQVKFNNDEDLSVSLMSTEAASTFSQRETLMIYANKSSSRSVLSILSRTLYFQFVRKFLSPLSHTWKKFQSHSSLLMYKIKAATGQ